jgi:hypothetical protein
LVRMIDRPELVRRLPAVGIFFRHLVLARLGIRRHPEDVR